MLPSAPRLGCEGGESLALGGFFRRHAIGTVLSLFGIIPKKMGSQEAFARELSLQLAERGWRSVLCFDRTPPEAVARHFALPNVCLEVIEAPERVRWRPLKQFVAILRRHRPDVVHLHYVGFLGLYPWLSRLCGVRRVYFTDHTSRPAFHVPGRAPLLKRLATRLINHPLSGVVCVSGYGHRCMMARGVLPADRFHLIYNGVDTGKGADDPARAAAFRRKHGIAEDRSIVTQVSWIIPEKGVGDLLEAWRLVLKETRRVQLVIVGDGESRLDFARFSEEMGLQEHVTWTGLVVDPFAEGVYAAADVVCQVSRWEEVFGFTIAEAMACGRPVVATRVGGIPELVRDGETGFLVPRSDVAQIAHRILELVADPGLRRRMGEAGREAAVGKFDLRRNTTQFLRLYGLA
jgi:glycosyltransferase involved in cell wall biosynthesis